jgi:hypothetical protein
MIIGLGWRIQWWVGAAWAALILFSFVDLWLWGMGNTMWAVVGIVPMTMALLPLLIDWIGEE